MCNWALDEVPSQPLINPKEQPGTERTLSECLPLGWFLILEEQHYFLTRDPPLCSPNPEPHFLLRSTESAVILIISEDIARF